MNILELLNEPGKTPSDPTTERWLPVVGFEQTYEVSGRGRVRTVATGLTRKLGEKKSGHMKISLWKGGKEKTLHVHSMVLEAFVGPRPEGLVACHENGNPGDNRVENLRWDTHSSNAYDKRKHGTDHKVNRTNCPRGHLLIEPNIVPSHGRSGIRSCRACSRERARHNPLGQPFSKANADWQYSRIMNGDLGRVKT